MLFNFNLFTKIEHTYSRKMIFLFFPADFYIPIFFTHFKYVLDLKNIKEQVKNYSVCTELSLFEYIDLEISKFLQILDLQPQISKFLLDHLIFETKYCLIFCFFSLWSFRCTLPSNYLNDLSGSRQLSCQVSMLFCTLPNNRFLTP